MEKFGGSLTYDGRRMVRENKARGPARQLLLAS